jgi:hypothetical protein
MFFDPILFVVCPEYVLQTSYSTCASTGGDAVELPPYGNCCFLQAAMPNATGCILHLQDGTDFVCGF